MTQPRMRRTIALGVLSGGLLLSGLWSVTQAASDMEGAAQALKAAGIVQGDEGTGVLRLNDNINRAELMKIVVAASTEGADPAEFKNCFPDVKEEWFARFICWANQNDYIEGYPDGSFAAAKPVNTVEAIKIISEVFHLDFNSVAATADKSIWYDVYMKNAERQGLIDGPLGASVLGRPATRGEVFEYLFRAMALRAMGEEQFMATDTNPLIERAKEHMTREMTDAEKALIEVARAQLSNGFDNVSASADVQLKVSVPTKYDHNLEFDMNIKEQMKTKGNNGKFEGLMGELDMDIDVKGFSSAQVAGNIKADVTVMADADNYYARINEITITNITAENELAVGAFQMLAADMENAAGKWYSMDRDILNQKGESGYIYMEKLPLGFAGLDLLDASLKTQMTPYANITMPNADDASVLQMTFDADRFPDFLANAAAKANKRGNRYAVAEKLRTLREDLKTLAGNIEVEVTYDTESKLAEEVKLSVASSTVTGPNGKKTSIELESTKEISYPETVELTFPTDAKAIKYIPVFMPPRD